jgi:ABC-type branched-subunit amino acid transport system substrate-binding protein
MFNKTPGARRQGLATSTPLYAAAFSALFAAAALLAAAGAHAQEVLIGQVASQTNLVTGANGKGMFIGINASLASVNAAGGVNGKQIKLLNKDDDAKGPKMVEITQEYIANKDVVALLGYVNTGGLTEIVKKNMLSDAGIALVSPLQGDKAIVGAENFFPFRSGYPDEVAALVKEAAGTQKKRVVFAWFNVTFGPAMEAFAQAEAKKIGLNVVGSVKIDAQVPPDKLNDVVKQVSADIIKLQPDAVIMLTSSRYVAEITKVLKNSPAEQAQIYAMSVVWAADIVKAAGEDKARGAVIAQAVPFPYSATLPVVGEYQKTMTKFAPSEAYSFPSLEGFIAAKITVEAIKRAGPNPTREKVLKALSNMGEVNLGGVYVDYSAKARRGWGGVDLTVIGAKGKLLR